MGDGISEGNDEELLEINNITNNQNNLVDQPVGNDIEEVERSMEEEEHRMDEENPTTYTTTVNPQHTSSKKLGKLH